MSDAPPEHASQSLPVGMRVGFETRSEAGRVVLTLSDGAELHVHPIVVDVLKTAGTDETGDPVYTVVGGLAIRLMTPPTSKR